MINGYNGETVALFAPAFRDHAMTVFIGTQKMSGMIESTALGITFRATFGGKNIRDILDVSSAVYLVKLVPAVDLNVGLPDLSPLDLVDELSN